MEDKILRKFQAKSVLLTLLVVGLVSLFSVGCGNSRDQFVATGNNNGTGNLVFRFVKAQATVPANTAQLVFSLHSGNPPTNANLVETRGPIAFNTTVTLTGVPTNVTTVVVTALDSNGLPIAVLSGTGITVAAGQSTNVNLGTFAAVTLDAITATPNPVNLVQNGAGVQLVLTGSFSNGSTATLPISNSSTTFTFAKSNVATASPTGLFSTTFSGVNSSVTAAYTLANVTKSTTFQVNAFDFQATAVGSTNISKTASYNSGYTVSFLRSDGTSLANVTQNLTYSLSPTVSNLSINASNGAITNSGTTSVSTFDVIVSWTDPVSKVTFTDKVPFTTF